MGRDLFSRMILEAGISLTVPFAGTIISFVLGIIIGGISGYFGGVIDIPIQRIIEFYHQFLQSLCGWLFQLPYLPIFPLLECIYILQLLSFISWTGLARIVRGKFISLRKEDYVMAAKISGVSNFKIITKHLVPGFMSYLIVSLTLGIPGMIIAKLL